MARYSDHTKKKNMRGKLGKLGASLRPWVQTCQEKKRENSHQTRIQVRIQV